jgi:hypothetical protein
MYFFLHRLNSNGIANANNNTNGNSMMHNNSSSISNNSSSAIDSGSYFMQVEKRLIEASDMLQR